MQKLSGVGRQADVLALAFAKIVSNAGAATATDPVITADCAELMECCKVKSTRGYVENVRIGKLAWQSRTKGVWNHASACHIQST